MSAPHTTAILGDTFLVSAQPGKPILNVWQLNRREQRAVKQTTPGVVQVCSTQLLIITTNISLSTNVDYFFLTGNIPLLIFTS